LYIIIIIIIFKKCKIHDFELYIDIWVPVLWRRKHLTEQLFFRLETRKYFLLVFSI
jgi:hypothetical protein